VLGDVDGDGAGVPAGLVLYLQEWVVDPLGPAGFAASNAVRATAE
jgi:hypothetical protein